MKKIKIHYVKPLTPINSKNNNIKSFPSRKCLYNKNLITNLKYSKDDNQFSKSNKLKNKLISSLLNSKKKKVYKKIYPEKNNIFQRQFSVPIFTNIKSKNYKTIYEKKIPKTHFSLSKNLTFSNLNKNSISKIDYFTKIPMTKNLNSYYFLSDLPFRKKFLIEQPNYDILSTKREKRTDIENNYKKIDKLSNDLCLFQIKREFFKENSTENLIKTKNNFNFFELDKSKDKKIEKQIIKNNYNSNNTKYFNYNSINNSINNSMNAKTPNDYSIFSKIKNKNFSETTQNLKQMNSTKNSTSKKPKKIINKEKENSFTSKKNEEFYRQVFFYHDVEKEIKRVGYINNKYNIVYAENEFQYNQKLLKLNDQLIKEGKSKIHPVEPDKNDIKMNELKDKVKFIKKILDYAYPNMVLSKVKEEKKRIFHSKSIEEKLPQFKIVRLASEQSQENLNLKLSGILKINQI